MSEIRKADTKELIMAARAIACDGVLYYNVIPEDLLLEMADRLEYLSKKTFWRPIKELDKKKHSYVLTAVKFHGGVRLFYWEPRFQKFILPDGRDVDPKDQCSNPMYFIDTRDLFSSKYFYGPEQNQ